MLAVKSSNLQTGNLASSVSLISGICQPRLVSGICQPGFGDLSASSVTAGICQPRLSQPAFWKFAFSHLRTSTRVPWHVMTVRVCA